MSSRAPGTALANLRGGVGRRKVGKSLTKREKLLQELDAINKVIERKKSKKHL